MSSEYEREKSSNSNKTVLIIVGAVVFVFVVAIAVCGGLGYFAFRAMQQGVQSVGQLINNVQVAQTTGEQFLTNIAGGDLDEAYAATSQSYQKEHTRKQFEEYVEKHPLLKNQASRTTIQMSPMQNQGTLQYTLSGAGKTGSCSLTITKEGEQWKIDRFSVP